MMAFRRIEDLLCRVERRLRFLATWRCDEPVVVFESDDWGLERRPVPATLGYLGTPAQRGEELSETPEDLERLYQVLEAHRDAVGRPACIVANFIMENPDFQKIIQNNYNKYYTNNVKQNKNLLSCYISGYKRKVFFPQYHGRHHFWPDAWLQDLVEAFPGARELCAAQIPGGLSLFSEYGSRYWGEYVDWRQGSPEASASSIAEGLNDFQETFGFGSLSTIAPHYVIPPFVLGVWKNAGVKFVQSAGNRVVRRPGGVCSQVSHVFGERSPEGLIMLGRTVLFEPRPEKIKFNLEAAVKKMNVLIKNKIPVVIDTHRINYTGKYGKSALVDLDRLIAEARRHGALFLTTTELGEAIARGTGQFHDAFTGQPRRLTPLDPIWRRVTRHWFSRWNHCMANYRWSMH